MGVGGPGWIRAGALTLAALASCSSPPKIVEPPIQVGLVRAWRVEDAEQVARLISKYEPQVKDLLCSFRDSPPVWMTDLERIGYSQGVTRADGILLGTDAHPVLNVILVHELGHWHSFPLGSLPPIVEEGVAMYTCVELGVASCEIDGDPRRANWPDVMGIDRREWARMSTEDKETGYGLGWWLIREIGFERLKGMVERDEASPRALLEAAGITPR